MQGLRSDACLGCNAAFSSFLPFTCLQLNEFTPLHYAVQKNDISTVDLVLQIIANKDYAEHREKGDSDAEASKGTMPLHPPKTNCISLRWHCETRHTWKVVEQSTSIFESAMWNDRYDRFAFGYT